VNLARLLERLLHLIPVLLGVSAIVFLMTLATPGDPVDIMLGEQQATPAQRAALRKDMGLDLPAPQRFIRFLENAATGNFGMSYFQRRPVVSVIAERLPATIELTLAALVIGVVVSIPLGVLAAIRKRTWIDRLATVGSLLGLSMPGFWFGLLLMMLFGVWMQWLPISGRSDIAGQVPVVTHFLTIDAMLAFNFEVLQSALSHLVMPALTLGLPMAAVLMRVTRASMLEVLRQDYVTFAQAKGLSTGACFMSTP
jgi:peptide/nickel transport system permease protein